MAWDPENKLRKLAPLSGQRADNAWRYYLGSEDRQEANDLLDLLLFQQVQKDYRKKIFLDPPPATQCDGEYPLGTVLYPPTRGYCRFGLRDHEWTQHVLIVGMTGAGKTTLAMNVLRCLQSHNTPFLVFDWKRNYRDLLQLAEFRTLRIHTVGRDITPFRFNPLFPPPGTLPGEWLMKLTDCLKHAYFVGEGVEYVLRRGLDYVYETTGAHDGVWKPLPTVNDVRNFVLAQRLHGRMSLWKASALRVLESLCFRHGLGPVLNTSQALQPELLKEPIVLELDALSDSDKIFFTEALILWLYEYRKNRGTREQFRHALVIEEAHHILSEHKERSAGAETIMETCLRQIREFGEAVLVIDQEPGKLSNSIKANTNTKITFNLGNARDIHETTKNLGLTDNEQAYIDLLTTGHAIVSLRSRQTTAMHVRFPALPLHKGAITDSDLRQRHKRRHDPNRHVSL